MDKGTKTLGEYLNEIRQAMSQAEGRPYDSPIPWRELAARCVLPDGTSIPENTLLRWEKNAGKPSRIDQIAALSNVFGSGVLKFMDIDVDENLLWFFANQNDPNVREELRKAKESAEQRMEQDKDSGLQRFSYQSA